MSNQSGNLYHTLFFRMRLLIMINLIKPFRWYLALIVILSLPACGGSSPSLSLSSSAPAAPPLQLSQNRVEFNGSLSEYQISRTPIEFEILEKSTGKLSKFALSTELLKFSDVTITTNMQSISETISDADLKILVELYVAFFNRVPDAEGLAYWIGERRNGRSVGEIADVFYWAAIQYSAQTGYSADMSNADFVRIIYKNVLGRSGPTAPPIEDVNYWAEQLNTGKSTKGGLILTILSVAHNFVNHPEFGWVPALLDNKYAVAADFSIAQGITINKVEDSLIKTMAIAAAVTPTSSDVAKEVYSSWRRIAVKAATPQLTGPIRFVKGNPSMLEMTFDRDMSISYHTSGSYELRSAGWRSDKRTFFMEIAAYTPNSQVTFSGKTVDDRIAFSSAELVSISEDIVFFFPKDDAQLLLPPVVYGVPTFTAGSIARFEVKFDSDMQATYGAEGDFNLKSAYWKSDKRSFVMEFDAYRAGTFITLAGTKGDGSPGFVSLNKVPMGMNFVFKIPGTDSSGLSAFSKVIQGPTFTVGAIPSVSITFDRAMGVGFLVKGDYIPRNSYWTADKRTFVVELLNYQPGGKIEFIGGSNSEFKSNLGEPLEQTVSFTFPL